MRKMLATATLAAFSLSTLFVAAPSVSAEEISCVGTLGPRTVDNVRVPQGKSCTLDGTQVQGNVVVERNASLTARQARINGSVQAEGHRQVVVNGSRVGGSLQFDQGGLYRVANTQVTGSIQAKANDGDSRLRSNTVNADVQVFNHTGGIAIADNRIDGNLQCKENSPAPTGGGNVVQGNKEDQCRGL